MSVTIALQIRTVQTRFSKNLINYALWYGPYKMSIYIDLFQFFSFIYSFISDFSSTRQKDLTQCVDIVDMTSPSLVNIV